MLSASFLSLIIPALQSGRALFGSDVAAAAAVVLGVLLGGGFIALLNETVPHEHFVQGRQGPAPPHLARIWLFVLAITIHNLPEGLAVGVGFGGGDIATFDMAHARQQPIKSGGARTLALRAEARDLAADGEPLFEIVG